jgi:transposase InsO family protein
MVHHWKLESREVTIRRLRCSRRASISRSPLPERTSPLGRSIKQRERRGWARSSRAAGRWRVSGLSVFRWQGSRTDSSLSAVAQRLDQSRESRRLLTSTGIVEVVAGKRRRPVRQHPDQFTGIHMGLRHVLGREGMPRPCSAAFLITAISSTVSCPSTRTLISRAPFSNSQVW